MLNISTDEIEAVRRGTLARADRMGRVDRHLPAMRMSILVFCL